ncbi:MAG: NAD(+)/NADH kinase [Chloroflexi bacterium]|nr:NAD(+)/NADH kinase [Chloroflexota bacterium]
MSVQSPDSSAFSAAFKRAAVLYHPKIEASEPLAREIAAALNQAGCDAWLALTWDQDLILPRMDETGLIIVLGGDGSLLRAARMSAAHPIPLLGVNMGRVGFLTEVSPDTWQEKLPRVLAGDYWLEDRLMIEATAWRGDEKLGEHLALNDVVISRGALARVVRLRTEIDNNYLTTYVADGLIVSTPTGSTAYAMAAGGPILPPELRNILVLPIAPHLTLDRAIVLSEGAEVTVRLKTDHTAILTVDGQTAVEMQNGDHVCVTTSSHKSRFIRLGKRTYFYDALIERLAPKRDR